MGASVFRYDQGNSLLPPSHYSGVRTSSFTTHSSSHPTAGTGTTGSSGPRHPGRAALGRRGSTCTPPSAPHRSKRLQAPAPAASLAYDAGMIQVGGSSSDEDNAHANGATRATTAPGGGIGTTSRRAPKRTTSRVGFAKTSDHGNGTTGGGAGARGASGDGAAGDRGSGGRGSGGSGAGRGDGGGGGGGDEDAEDGGGSQPSGDGSEAAEDTPSPPPPASQAVIVRLRRASTFSPLGFRTVAQRAFTLAWAGLALAFASAFAPAALAPVIQSDLGLSKAVVGGAGAAALAASSLTRVLAAAWVRRVGPRYCQVAILLATAPLLACMALVHSGAGLIAVRCCLGAALAQFVVSQFWVVAHFDARALGAAAATCASWGNAGAGPPMLLLPLLYVGLKKLYDGDVRAAWHATFYAPAVLLLVMAALSLAYGQDTAAGDILDGRNRGLAGDARAGTAAAALYWRQRRRHEDASVRAGSHGSVSKQGTPGGSREPLPGRGRGPSSGSSSSAAGSGGSGSGSASRSGGKEERRVKMQPDWLYDDGASEGEGGQEGQRQEAESGQRLALREAVHLHLLALRKPATLLLALSYGLNFGASLVSYNVLPLYFVQHFDLGIVQAGAIMCCYGLLNVWTRVSGALASNAVSRTAGFGMRGRLWLLWGMQTCGGLSCALLGGAAQPSLAATVLLALLFGVFSQQAAGALFAVAPFVSYRSYPAVMGIVSAGAHLVAVVLQAALFANDRLSYQAGFTWMGVAIVAASSLTLPLVGFAPWGSMLCGPAARGAAGGGRRKGRGGWGLEAGNPGAHQADEEDGGQQGGWDADRTISEEAHYLAEWTPEEQAAGLADSALAFARFSRAERGRPRGAAGGRR
ncbi:hypothetical protein HYH03_011206 [Edaphochlamys debaryana]|uniref:Uncharacterized protein n=1 Tax=Edaphochlamys debaryana TaxID=47281 RepID=A0A836BV97_9CHLO|nr:hypothetical protein HYH03_011206 [Edaphochlamys debaryana]|eukprot:KAG2490406.1 hypothetical protein HYH03_011206 [Edaphochlamys debaryana]